MLAHAQKTKEFHLDEVYSIATGGQIELESQDADVRIVGSNRSDVHVKVDYKLEVRGMTFGDDYDFRVEVKHTADGLLVREAPHSGDIKGIIGTMRESYTILLEVPSFVNLQIKGDDDDYTIKDISGDITLHAEDGDIEMRNTKGGIYKIFVDDADVEIHDGGGRLRLRGEDGDTRITNGDFSAIDLRVDDGDLDLVTRLYDRGKYQLEGADGDFDISFLSGGGDIWIKQDDGSLITNGAFEIRRHEDHNKELRLPGGTAQIRIQLEDGDLTLNTR
jgi:hypothetical protein